MSQFDPQVLLQYWEQYEFEIKLGLLIAIAVLFVLVVFFLIRKLLQKKEAPRTGAERTVSEVSKQAPAPEPASKPVQFSEMPRMKPQAPAPASPRHPIPQDSVLRRHHMTHVRHMIETINSPRPTDSVLRRHYEQQIASTLDACLHDDAQMDKLIACYEAHRRNARSRPVLQVAG